MPLLAHCSYEVAGHAACTRRKVKQLAAGRDLCRSLESLSLRRLTWNAKVQHLSTSTTRPQQQPVLHHEQGRQHASRYQDKLAERDLVLSVLSASTTKRDAKSYLSRYQPQNPSVGAKSHQVQSSIARRALRIALIKIRAPQSIDEDTLQGLAHTLSQLSLLGLSCVFVIDCEESESAVYDVHVWRQVAITQAERLVKALTNENNVKAQCVNYAIGVTGNESGSELATGYESIFVQYPDVITRIVGRGYIPVIPAIGYTVETQRLVAVAPDDIVLALTRQFVGFGTTTALSNTNGNPSSNSDQRSIPQTTVERIILLDPLGGLPSIARQDKSHVFINLMQEYGDIREELLGPQNSTAPWTKLSKAQAPPQSVAPVRPPSQTSKTLSKIRQGDNSSLEELETFKSGPIQMSSRHVQNLDLLQKTLPLLPMSSSALLTTPREAATLTTSSTDLGVITRRPKNPLIFNLLTDKPIVSSSLPEIRLASYPDTARVAATLPTRATFVKLGMPLTVVPDPKVCAWHAPTAASSLSLEQIGIDLPRLVALIEDSFGRPLNIEHYLDRIRGNLAGVIIAGEYEGGAILTWELPPGVPDDGSEDSRKRMVPYLDKFAVLRKSQGTGGVADIVFSAMVRTCFPSGVCWRSRKGNPVNKWYFERSAGTWKIPNTQWAMFWTTQHLLDDKPVFHDYENVCRSVVPSWADKANPAD